MLDLMQLIEVKLKEPDDFLKVRETLSRIGVDSKLADDQERKTLYQSCHILHKQGHYYVIHFKELFLLDGKRSDFSEEDRGRRNTIANLLGDWGLVELVSPEKSKEPIVPLRYIKILSYKEKSDWNLVAKYTIGKAKRRNEP
jgi:Bacteriophage translational regulator